MYSFPLEKNERILRKGLATLQRDHIILPGSGMEIDTMSGALYLTTERLVFVGYFMAATSRHIEEIPLEHVDQLIPEKSLKMFANAIRIRTIRDTELVFIVRGRDEWIRQINAQLDQI